MPRTSYTVTSGAKPYAKPSARKMGALPGYPEEEDPEDARIAWLEAKLGMARGKGRKKSLAFGDGLDGMHTYLTLNITASLLTTLVIYYRSGSRS